MTVANQPQVFVGTPAALIPQQRARLNAWLAWSEDQSLHVVRLERSAYDSHPWRQLARYLARADGVILLGFRQLDARNAIWRPETSEQDSGLGWWTTPWLQVEAGMAAALRIPVLVAAEGEVKEGVFSPDVWAPPLYGTALEAPDSSEWLEVVRRRWKARAGT